MIFQVIPRDGKVPDAGRNAIYLQIDHWNDYSYVTMFYLSMHDSEGSYHVFGNIKIGFVGQTIEQRTFEQLGHSFESLPEGYFSLGEGVEYYREFAALTKEERDEILLSLRDVVISGKNLETAESEHVFRTSLLRGVSLPSIKGQFLRVLNGGVPLTDFKFKYVREEEERFGGIDLVFKVKAESKPSTNIHAVIGRNGVGKTTILNGMIEAITDKENSKGSFFDTEGWGADRKIGEDYFSSMVSVSFSAFDPFSPPKEQPNPTQGTCYFYIGLRDSEDREKLKILPELYDEFKESVSVCLSQEGKRKRWISAIQALESDDNFTEMDLRGLVQLNGEALAHRAEVLMKRMSSGHVVVLLTITKLVATVEEKTLVLIDEPESHLHPPLLSAFVRALSELLYDRNGVAIIATHSPVVLQEVPKSCVWKVARSRLEISWARPESETFGENVGVLTRDVFGLEVIKSGFHKLLYQSVEKGMSYDEILDEYDNQLGYEGRAILKAMVLYRDRKA